jgi:hypothetical protein
VAEHPEDGDRNQIAEASHQLVDQARSSLRDARDQAAASLSESRKRAGTQLGGLATALQKAGEHLRTENQASVAHVADSLARKLEGVSRYVQDNEMAAMVDDLEQFARRRPAAVLGFGLVVGLLGARFLKSSDRGRELAGGSNARA